MTRSLAGAIAAIVLLGCTSILLFKAFLFSEASEMFTIVLERGVAYRIDQALVATRPMMWIPMIPTIALRPLTDRLDVLVLAFGAPHVLVPFLAVLGVLFGLRGRPPNEVFVALCGICLIGLPGQIYVVSGQLMVCQMFWLVLVCLVNWEGGRFYRWAFAVLVLALFFLNPVVTPILAVTGLFLIVRWVVVDPRWRGGAIAGVSLLLAAALRAGLLFATSDAMRIEDSTHPSLMKLQATFFQPRMTFVITYFVCTLAAAFAALRGERGCGRVASVFLLGASASIAAFFAGNPMALQHGVNYLGWAFVLSIPLYLGFLHRALMPAEAAPPQSSSRELAVALLLPPTLFLVTVFWASRQFDRQVHQIRDIVEQRPSVCVEQESLFKGVNTSLDDQFGVFKYVFLATGASRTTSKVVLDEGRCRQLCGPGQGGGDGFFILRFQPAPDQVLDCPLRNLLD